MSRSGLSARHKWGEIDHRQRTSGLSVAAFCRREGISAASLYVWRRRLGGSGAASGFVEAKIVGSRSESGAIVISLRGARRLMVRAGFDHGLLAEVVTVLEGLA
jgi:transposase-like protein